MHIFPSISRSKGNQTMKFSQLTEYKTYFSSEIIKRMNRAYFSQLLRAVPTCNALFEICLTILQSKTFKFACCLGSFHLRIALNLLNYVFFIHSCLTWICPNEAGRLVPDLPLFFKNALYEVKASGLQLGFNIFG